VPTGGARRGRRDNGLSAAEYAAVGDVDPRVGEHLLDVLAVAGIAAYLQPATDLHPVTRTTTLPARPTDRLFADRAHLGTAREYLIRLRADETAAGDDPTPPSGQPEPLDVDAAWEQIVAGFAADPATPRWPASEDLPDEPSERDERPTDERPADGPRRNVLPQIDEPSLLDALDTFGADLPEATDDEGYTPPPPPPLPRLSRPAVLGILAILAGLVLFFFPELLPIDGDLAMFLAIGSLIAGVVTLIWRLRPGGDEDDDSDDGAVV
jgi:hypothetical protein